MWPVLSNFVHFPSQDPCLGNCWLGLGGPLSGFHSKGEECNQGAVASETIAPYATVVGVTSNSAD